MVYDDFDDEQLYLPGMSLVLAHEIAHTFGMEEVYDDDQHDTLDSFTCVMEVFEGNYAGIFYRSIVENGADPFCDNCKEKLRTLVWQKIHLGN